MIAMLEMCTDLDTSEKMVEMLEMKMRPDNVD
jgi:hypothetical protein